MEYVAERWSGRWSPTAKKAAFRSPLPAQHSSGYQWTDESKPDADAMGNGGKGNVWGFGDATPG